MSDRRGPDYIFRALFAIAIIAAIAGLVSMLLTKS